MGATQRALLAHAAGRIPETLALLGGERQCPGVNSVSVQPCERVLVVEDNADALSTLQEVLELGGAQTEGATTVEQAWVILDHGFRPSIFVIDVHLGGGKAGDAFARELRTDPRFGGIPVVLLSGDNRRLRLSGDLADALLLKPFGVEDLYSVLSDLCLQSQGSCPTPEPARSPPRAAD